MKHLATALSALIFCAAASAQVTITDPWVRGTVPQQKASGLFMQIDAAQDVRLIGGSSPVAGVVEVHEMAMEGDVMKMRALKNGLEIAKGRTMALKPGGYHVMLMELKQPLKEGETIDLTLVFEKAGEVAVKVPVLKVGSPGPGAKKGSGGKFKSLGVAAPNKEGAEKVDCLVDALKNLSLPSPGSYAAKVKFAL